MTASKEAPLISIGEVVTHYYRKTRIAELVAEGDGDWVACSGCQESVDGCVSTKDYPYDPLFRCQPGRGCGECGGIGALWRDRSYYAMWKPEIPAREPAAADDPTTQLARHRDRDRVSSLAKCGLMLSLMNRDGHCYDGFDEFEMYNDVIVALGIEDKEDPDLTMAMIGEGEDFGLTLLDRASQPAIDRMEAAEAQVATLTARVETLLNERVAVRDRIAAVLGYGGNGDISNDDHLVDIVSDMTRDLRSSADLAKKLLRALQAEDEYLAASRAVGAALPRLHQAATAVLNGASHRRDLARAALPSDYANNLFDNTGQ